MKHWSIASEYDRCLLHERYGTGRDYSGESLNTYDAGRKVWHQTWVDTSGTLLLLEGGLRNGSVRQLWESTDAKGQWGIAFDGLYTRK